MIRPIRSIRIRQVDHSLIILIKERILFTILANLGIPMFNWCMIMQYIFLHFNNCWIFHFVNWWQRSVLRWYWLLDDCSSKSGHSIEFILVSWTHVRLIIISFDNFTQAFLDFSYFFFIGFMFNFGLVLT